VKKVNYVVLILDTGKAWLNSHWLTTYVS